MNIIGPKRGESHPRSNYGKVSNEQRLLSNDAICAALHAGNKRHLAIDQMTDHAELRV